MKMQPMRTRVGRPARVRFHRAVSEARRSAKGAGVRRVGRLAGGWVQRGGAEVSIRFDAEAKVERVCAGGLWTDDDDEPAIDGRADPG